MRTFPNSQIEMIRKFISAHLSPISSSLEQLHLFPLSSYLRKHKPSPLHDLIIVARGYRLYLPRSSAYRCSDLEKMSPWMLYLPLLVDDSTFLRIASFLDLYPSHPYESVSTRLSLTANVIVANQGRHAANPKEICRKLRLGQLDSLEHGPT